MVIIMDYRIEKQPEFEVLLKVEAVSYTHLDVYKRQIHLSAAVKRAGSILEKSGSSSKFIRAKRVAFQILFAKFRAASTFSGKYR